MSSMPECKRCGDYVYYGPILCEGCTAKLEAQLTATQAEIVELKRQLNITQMALNISVNGHQFDRDSEMIDTNQYRKYASMIGHRDILALCDEIDNLRADMITDGFGTYCQKRCSNCGAPMQVIRPGDIRCSAECYIKREAAS